MSEFEEHKGSAKLVAVEQQVQPSVNCPECGGRIAVTVQEPKLQLVGRHTVTVKPYCPKGCF